MVDNVENGVDLDLINLRSFLMAVLDSDIGDLFIVVLLRGSTQSDYGGKFRQECFSTRLNSTCRIISYIFCDLENELLI